MVKVKTGIYVDKELWERFRKYAMSKGVEVSKLEYSLVDALVELAGSEDYKVDASAGRKA